MSYIQESLSAGEKIYKLTNYHWMYLVGSFIGAFLFVMAAFFLIFLGIIYHYYDPMKLPPWKIFEAASGLALSDYAKAFWHINVLFRVGGFILVLMGLLQIGARLLVIATTEMAVTNRRVVFKRGWISRRVEEMRIDYIEGADVGQTIGGRIFGYGVVRIYGTGSETIFFPAYTADPINFRRALESARTTHHNPAVPQPHAMPGHMQPGVSEEIIAEGDRDAAKEAHAKAAKNTVAPRYT